MASDLLQDGALAKGQCYCGGIRFTVPLAAPIKACYCHCDSCRRAHSAPLYQVVYIKNEGFHITQGEELVQYFEKTLNGVVRSFCKVCGSRVSNTWTDEGRASRKANGKLDIGTGFFPSLLDSDFQKAECFQPKTTYFTEEAIITKDADVHMDA
eukprot:gene9346-12947_t